jgi:hypothetical protein
VFLKTQGRSKPRCSKLRPYGKMRLILNV